MRINNISQNNFNYNKVNNVSFGRHVDDNAAKVVHDAVEDAKTKNPDPVVHSMYDSWVERMEKDKNFLYYTDKESGKVKGKFNKEFVESNSDTTIYSQRVITNGINRLKRYGSLDDLSILGNIEDVARKLRNYQKVLKGIDLAEERRKCLRGNDESENYAAMRAKEETYR